MSERGRVERAMERLLATEPANAGVASRWTALTHGRLHHLEAGAGSPVVLLHGGTGGGANWFRQIGHLSARHRVLAPDLPGFGLSDPATPRAPLGSAAADILEAWLHANDVRDALVAGTSFGGLAALRLALRPSAAVARLFLLDSAGLASGIHPAVRLASAGPWTHAAVRPTLRGTKLLLQTLLTSDRSALEPATFDALATFIHATGTAAGTPYLTETLRLFVGRGGQREVLSGAELRRIGQPTTVVWGRRDRMLPVTHAYHAARSMPAARLRIIPQAGHSPNWETPDPVLDAIEELAMRPSAGLA